MVVITMLLCLLRAGLNRTHRSHIGAAGRITVKIRRTFLPPSRPPHRNAECAITVGEDAMLVLLIIDESVLTFTTFGAAV